MTPRADRQERGGGVIDDLLPPVPGGGRAKLAALALILGLIGGDAFWLKGAVFNSWAWRLCQWGLVGLGLGVGVVGHWRSRR